MLFRREGSPYWYYEFQVGGRRFRESTGATSEREAKKVEREAHARARAEAAAAKAAPDASR